jgi:transcriptional regulator with XRE-family HTH domain
MNEPLTKLQQIVNLQYHGNQREAADDMGISESYLSLILKGKRTIPDKIMRRMGYDWQIVRVTPMPHPDDAVDVPSLVERKLTEEN